MRARTLREGSVGLMILLGIGLFGLLIAWLRGFNPANRSYRFVAEFPTVEGLQSGAPVRYRGVRVGNISRIQAGANAIDVEVEIAPATLRIPKAALIQVNQSGLVGETSIDITPQVELPDDIATAPLDGDCDSALIICNGDRLAGEVGISFIRLLGATIRFVDLIADPALINQFRELVENTSDAASGVATLTGEFSLLTRTFGREIQTLSNSASFSTIAVGNAATQVGTTVNQVGGFLRANQNNLSSILDNINSASRSLELVLGRLEPVVSDEEIVRNLRTLSSNAAQASISLSNFSNSVGSEETILLLQQTLDSARATFQNAEKVTADLDELTGDPAFRRNVRQLVNGLSNLVSSTDELEQQVEIAVQLQQQEAEITSTPSRIFPASRENFASTPISPDSAVSSPSRLTLLDPTYQIKLTPFPVELLRSPNEIAPTPLPLQQPVEPTSATP